MASVYGAPAFGWENRFWNQERAVLEFISEESGMPDYRVMRPNKKKFPPYYMDNIRKLAGLIPVLNLVIGIKRIVSSWKSKELNSSKKEKMIRGALEVLFLGIILVIIDIAVTIIKTKEGYDLMKAKQAYANGKQHGDAPEPMEG